MNNRMQSKDLNNVVGVLLAGGQARRFGGGDKCLRLLGGEALLSQVVKRAGHQADPLIINASGDRTRFKDYDLDVVADCLDGSLGPLAGILTGMEWARAHVPTAKWVASFATDAPFLPLDLVDRLQETAEKQSAKIAVARSGGHNQPVFALWSLDLADDLRQAITDRDVRKVMAWAGEHDCVFVDFEMGAIDPFFNINTEEDLAQAEAFLLKEAHHE